MGWIGLDGLVGEIEQGINMDNVNRVTMTHGDFGVCLAALVQAESYWDFQLNRCDGDMPGGFTRPEAGEILRSLKEEKLVPLLLEAIKELELRVKDLENKAGL